jgi:two-component system, chemotaxis family, CheB/CheR fusion protein
LLETEANTDLPIIAIGASAGGLEACTALLRDMPGDLHAALILVLHLDPSHSSMMVDLLAQHTRLRVVQATEGMALQPGCVHVIPPGVFLTVSRHILHVSEPPAGVSVRLPYDVLLRSLAHDPTAPLACIVLSGTGTDGSLGIAQVRAAKGLVIAQDPQEAHYAGMPESAINTGFVTKTLRVGDMVAPLQELLQRKGAGHSMAPNVTARPGQTSQNMDLPGHPDYDEILNYVDQHAKQSISLYKRGTLERRIARRMAIVGLGPGDVARYLGVLKADARERAQLSAELLIHVTSFFRDPAVFDYVGKEAIPKLLTTVAPDQRLRIWIAGCSTGEEAYSFAIMYLEAVEAAGLNTSLQIIASDIDPDSVATAQAGIYSKEIEASVSSMRLARFFIPSPGGWKVTTAVRDLVMFTVADLLIDPPFSNIDLISCRNVMIYLSPDAQKSVMARCCYALRPGGLLLLGSAETPAKGDSCFAVENKEARLWRRVGQGRPRDLLPVTGTREKPFPSHAAPVIRRNMLPELCHRILLEHYSPAAVLLNARLECLYFHGPTDRYLKITQGHSPSGILGMLPKNARAKFRAEAASCSPDNPLVTISAARTWGGESIDLAIHSIPAADESLLLVCFLEKAATSDRPGTGATTSPAHSGQALDLESELETTRKEINDALRDLEQLAEAHGADTAEALSANEEFQSANEELLASKEELQSLNEELTTLNSQLQETLERQRTTASDLQNVLFSTDVATLFLDLDLNIRFFTPAARGIYRVIPSDVGRPLADLVALTKDEQLTHEALTVLRTSERIEREVPGKDGQWFMRRIQPYRDDGGRVAGIVITYIDITERKRTNAALVSAIKDAERATRAKTRFLAVASHDLRQPLQALTLLHELMAQNKRPTEVARLYSLVDGTLKSMTEMLDSLLEVSRIESGIIRPHVRPIAIAPIIQRLVDEFRPQCDMKGLKLRSVTSNAWVKTDPQLMEQILRNLLSNALKYTLTGGILIGCLRKGPELSIRVYDSGIGFSEAESKEIFEAYYQVKGPTSLSRPGLGLGLSIVQRLAQLMKHTVTVHSTPGKGTAFMISLPIAEVAPGLMSGQTQPQALTMPSPETGRILLVEDEKQLRELLCELLTSEGHTVLPMANARDALEWATACGIVPDLLLTDYDLEDGKGGLILAQSLARILPGSIPTIILTGDITTETHEQIAKAGCQQIIKPAAPKALLQKISLLIQNSRQRAMHRNPEGAIASLSVHVIDDDPLIRETMRRLFEAEGWSAVTYESAEEFLASSRPASMTCLLIDSVLPGMSGIELIRHLRAENSSLPAVVLTGHGDATTAVAALKAGASDLIEKPASAIQLLDSVRKAIGAAQDISLRANFRKTAQQQLSALTKREHEILARILEGAPNKIIAADLGINQRTVENHRASVMRKLGVASLPDLVRLALAADMGAA